MDIEKLRKMKETENDLRIHNITDAPQEAIDSVHKDLEMSGQKVPGFEEAYDLSKKENFTGDPMNTEDVETLKQKVEEQSTLLAQQAKLIHQLQGAVNDIIREVKKMQGTVPTKDPAQRQKVLQAEDKKEHPRSSGYTPDDVSVEKFFYSGDK